MLKKINLYKIRIFNYCLGADFNQTLQKSINKHFLYLYKADTNYTQVCRLLQSY